MKGYLTRKADYIKAAVASYWRYKRQCPLVTVETNAKLRPWAGGDRADVLVMTKDKMLVEIEVKTNTDDLKNDARKQIHKDLFREKVNAKYPVHAFFFAVYKDIKDEALEIIKRDYPHAGLIVVYNHRIRMNPVVWVEKLAKKFNKPPLGDGQVRQLMKAMSATTCRLMYENVKLNETIAKEKIGD